MKYAIIFAFAAFAVLAQTNARSVVGESADRGAIIQALKKKLAETKEKLSELINYAHDKLKVAIAEVRKQTEILIGELTEHTTDISNQVYEAAQKILDKADVLEDKVVEQAKNIINKFTGNHSKEHIIIEDSE